MFFANSRQTLARRIDELELLVERIQGELKSSLLDADELRDQARRMLNRSNAQRRWIEQKDPERPNGDHKLTHEEINSLIQDGRWPR